MTQVKNKAFQPFLTLLLVLVVLVVVSLFETKLDVFGFQTKEISPFSDILLKGAVKNAPLPTSVITDSMIAKDSSEFALRQLDPTNIVDFQHDSTTALAHFFKALLSTQHNKTVTRIAYFGDSMIEGDLISQDLRSLMQDRFGGNGVGYVPITSIVSGFRKSVKHSFSGWRTYNFFKEPPTGNFLSISGYGFIPEQQKKIDTTLLTSNVWVKYKTVDRKYLNRFYTTKLLYGKSTGKNSVVINNKRYLLTGTNTVNQLVIEHQKDSLQVEAYFQCEKPLDIYGFSLESGDGVVVDNFSFRGNSGLPNYRVPKDVYAGINQCLEYDLIILQYGLNAVSPTITTYGWYEIGMNNVIRHLKESFPGVSILLVSVGDKSYNKDGVFQTDPSVPLLLESQKRLAANNQIAFWSLYDAMGGYGSMVQWVEGDTAFANKDYAHFNALGSQRVGALLFNKLMIEYTDYYKQDNVRKLE
jgi:hypothetical protein